MVSHTKDEIKEGLTTLPSSLETQAKRNFRDILGWMSDKPIPESRRLSYSHDIVAVAKSSPPMTDEVYCQVMKQLTNNPSQRSVLLGWKLLLMLCQEARASPELQEFVRGFLTKNIRVLRSDGGEVLMIARQCLSDFNRHAKEDPGDAAGAVGDDKMMDVIVTLIDHSTRKVKVKESAALLELGDALASQIRLHRIQDFRFFQLLVADEKSGEVQRLLPVKTGVKSLLEKWVSLEAKTKKKSCLLLKRIWIESTDVLRVGDMTHATLTYRQVLFDFLHYPIWEDKALVVATAASMLLAERDSMCQAALGRKDLSGTGELEQAIPEHVLRFDKNRKKWSQAIIAKFDALEQTTDPGEPRLQKMSRVLVNCQKFKLFGSLHWFAQQLKAAPEGKVPNLDNIPPCSLRINEKQPQGEYWLSVNRSGIMFVPYDAAPGEDFKRSFQFHDEAMDRIVRWGFKQDLVQLVVSACDKDNVAAGVVEWVISLMSPSAPDICFAIQHSKPR